MNYEIKALSVGEILDGAFQLYRNHFGVFLAAAAAIALPALLILNLMTWGMTGTFSGTLEGQPGVGDVWPIFLLYLPVSFATYVLEQSVLTVAIADAYLGRPVSVANAFRRTGAVLGSLVAAAVLTGLGIWFGLILLVVPGIVLMLTWLFTVQAITVEGCDAFASIRRSKALTTGRRGRLALLVILLAIINLAISLGVGAVIPDSIATTPFVGALAQQVPAILLAPIYPGVLTLAYFDARVRNEAFDLEMLSRSIGGSAPAVAPVTAL